MDPSFLVSSIVTGIVVAVASVLLTNWLTTRTRIRLLLKHEPYSDANQQLGVDIINLGRFPVTVTDILVQKKNGEKIPKAAHTNEKMIQPGDKTHTRILRSLLFGAKRIRLTTLGNKRLSFKIPKWVEKEAQGGIES